VATSGPRERSRPSRPARVLVLQPQCLEDLAYWVETDRRVARRVLELMQMCLREPFTGLGKPEPLKALGSDVWSRRITQADRLVYVVYDDRIDFLQARYHY
jgi:toxin YoeB